MVRAKAAVGKPLPRLAITLYGPPAVLLAVKVGAVAAPLLSVLTVAVVTLPGNVPLVPLDGAVNVTGKPLFVSPDSVTVAFSAIPKAVLMTADCGVPAVAVTV